MIGTQLESRIAKQAHVLQRAERLPLHVAVDRILQAFHLAPKDRTNLYRAVENRITAHNRKVEKVNALVEAASRLYNDRRHPVGMPDAIRVALNDAGIKDPEDRRWYAERVARRLQRRSVARRKANLASGAPKKRGGGRSEALRQPGQIRLPLPAPRARAQK